MKLLGPYFILRSYVLLTEIVDKVAFIIHKYLNTSLSRQLNKAVALLLNMMAANCTNPTMIDTCPNENVTFWLYTKEAKEPYQLREDNISSLVNAPFDVNVPIKVLVHGYTGFRDHDPNPQIRPNYLLLGYNVISIDYGPVARKPCYFHAVENAKTVGRCLGNFIDLLLKHNKNIDKKYIHIVSFSLGAHVGAYAGTYLRKKHIELERLTVLDAAAPLFYSNTNFTHMKCAKFIDVIHTNSLVYGKAKRVGHVDFYVNYLLFQRGCSILDVSCNHLRAPLYFGESIITNVGFWGYPVDNTKHVQIMGEYTPPTAEGIYYLATNSESPYATGRAFPADFRRVIDCLSNRLAHLMNGIGAASAVPRRSLNDVNIDFLLERFGQ